MRSETLLCCSQRVFGCSRITVDGFESYPIKTLGARSICKGFVNINNLFWFWTFDVQYETFRLKTILAFQCEKMCWTHPEPRSTDEVSKGVFPQICFWPNNEFYRKMENKVQQNVKWKVSNVANRNWIFVF